ncbi:22592_t:CDS:2, partial [Entrophospora sp. SA101]
MEIKSILNNVQQHVKDFCIFFEKYKNESLQDKLAASGIMDLTSKSMLSNKVPEKTYRTFISSLDTFDKLIPDEEHVFLVYFFGQFTCLEKLSPDGFKEKTKKIMIRVIKKTFDN